MTSHYHDAPEVHLDGEKMGSLLQYANPLKRLHNDVTLPNLNLRDHNVRTAGVNVEDFLSHAEKLSGNILNSMEFLQSFVSSNDPQLVVLAQLPHAFSILHAFHMHIRNKKNELIRHQPPPFPQYKYFSSMESSSKIRRPDSPPHEHPSLPSLRPFFFSSPDPHSLGNRPQQPPPFALQKHLVLPEGELIANPSNIGLEWNKMSLSNFELLGELGNGAFGTVRLCREKSSGKLFCVKILDRNRIRFLKQREHIINERTIMFSVNHPFIVKLFCTFKSPGCLFFLMEFVAGGELFNYIRAEEQFSNETTKLVAAEIILALQYLHNQDIIYRDIKPENLLVDHLGHLKLTDFGFAKHIDDRTNSMCGTLDYMAPEILMAKGHGKAADWWSLGILIYEMLSGCPPLLVDPNETRHAMHLINSGKLEYPAYFDTTAIDLIKRLLIVDEKERLSDAEEIKRHPWFSNLDWASVIQKEGPGPMASLKAFKLHMGTKPSPSGNFHNDINLREEMAKAGPCRETLNTTTKPGSFDGFEGFRGGLRS